MVYLRWRLTQAEDVPSLRFANAQERLYPGRMQGSIVAAAPVNGRFRARIGVSSNFLRLHNRQLYIKFGLLLIERAYSFVFFVTEIRTQIALLYFIGEGALPD